MVQQKQQNEKKCLQDLSGLFGKENKILQASNRSGTMRASQSKSVLKLARDFFPLSEKSLKLDLGV